MPIDVVTEIEIARPRAEVAAYASNPDNATTWYGNVKRAERLSPTRVAFEARFLGKTLRYTYEIAEDVSGERLRHAEQDHGMMPPAPRTSRRRSCAGRTQRI